MREREKKGKADCYKIANSRVLVRKLPVWKDNF